MENFSEPASQYHTLIVSICLYLLSWQVSYKIPDVCVAALLLFLYHLFTVVASLTFCTQLKAFAQGFPRNVKHLQKISGVDACKFLQYAVCPKCNSIYDIHSCVVTRFSSKESKCCQHISFPNHPHLSRRKKCSQPLMKCVKRNAAIHLRPFRVFCYHSIKVTLQEMFMRPNFIEMCERWRDRNIPDGTLADIYDGRVWKEFMVVNDTSFEQEI